MRICPPALCCMAVAATLTAQTPAPSKNALPAKTPPPKTWVDPDTGHRVVRLTDEPGSASLYFKQNGYTADGKKLIYTTPDGNSALNLATRATNRVVTGAVRVIVTGRKSQNVYYTKGD